jgi:hypothetical protein
MTILKNRRHTLKVTLLLLAAVLVSAPAWADDLVTVGGKRYEKVRVTEVTPVTIAFKHSTGIARLPFTDFGPDVQKNYGYDAVKANAWLAAQAKAEQDRQQCEAAAKTDKRGRAGATQQQVEAMAARLGNTVYDGATHRWYPSQQEAAFARERALRDALQARWEASGR